MSMVETVARAIAIHGFGRPWEDFEEVNAHDTDQGDLLEYARAAIAAMRTPTNEQLDAALAGDGRWGINAIPRIAAAWRCMIDAALAADKGGAV